MSDWQIQRESVWRLYRDGQVIRDGDGRPMAYGSEEEAQHVAANWDIYRTPTIAELRAMPDEELVARAEGTLRRWGWLPW
jgi:hypothetical protein